MKEAKEIFSKNGIVNFDFPNKAVDILEKMIIYGRAKQSLKPYKYTDPVGEIRLRKEQMDYIAALNKLKKYGIKTLKTIKIKTKKDLEKINYPAVMKVVGKHLVHKTEEKAVALNIKNKIEAAKVLADFGRLLKQHGTYCVAQPMVKGIEMIAGIKKDRSFGHIIIAGMGGIYTEVLKDVQTEVDDVDGQRAVKMIEKLKMYPILKGTRGHSAYDIKGIANVVIGLARLASVNGTIQELDINPLFVTEKGVFAADVRIII
jgi:acyl-CoA synthetase (NDP forming)